MPTPVLVTGFEHGSVTALANGTTTNRYWTSTAGTFTIESGAARTGGFGLRVPLTAGNSVLWDTNLISTGTILVGSFWFKLSTEPTTDTIIACWSTTAAADSIELVYIPGSNAVEIRTDTGGGTVVSTGSTVAGTTEWHQIDYRIDVTNNPWTIDWVLNGIPQAQVTASNAGAADVTDMRLGTPSAGTGTCDYDDLIVSRTSADYPLGAGKVILLKPTAVSISGTAANFSTFTANGTLAAWNNAAALANTDEVPPVFGASSDGAVQDTTATSDYMAFQMETYTLKPGESVAGLRMLAPGWATSGTAATIGFRSFNGTTETTLLAAADPAFDNATTTAWVCKMCTASLFSTQDELDALTFRVGFSGDAAPDIGVHAVYGEVAIIEAKPSPEFPPRISPGFGEPFPLPTPWMGWLPGPESPFETLIRTDLLGSITPTGAHGTGTFVTASFTPPDNSLLVVGVSAQEPFGSTNPVNDLSISGGGLTWTSRVAIGSASSWCQGLRIWTAPVTTGASMTLTFDFAARSAQYYAYTAVAYENYNVDDPIGGTGTVVDTASPDGAQSLTLDATPDASSEIFAILAIDKNNVGCTPGSTFTELFDVQHDNDGGQETEIRTGSTSTNVDWIDSHTGAGSIFKCLGGALEIKANPSGPEGTNALAEDALVGFVANNISTSIASNADEALLTIVSNDAIAAVSVNAEVALVAFAANNASAVVAPNTDNALIAFIADEVAPSVATSSEVALIGVAAFSDVPTSQDARYNWAVTGPPGVDFLFSPAVPWMGTDYEVITNDVFVSAGVAAVLITSQDVAASVAAKADNASITVVADNGTSSLASNASNAVISVAANAISTGVAPNAETALVTIAANSSAPSVAVNAGIATIAITAFQPGSGRTPAEALLAFASGDVDASIAVNTGVASLTTIANNGTPSVAVNAECAVISLQAQQAAPYVQNSFDRDLRISGIGLTPFSQPVSWMGSHVFISPDVFVVPSSADITVTANNPGKSVSVNAGVASITVTGHDSIASIRAPVGSADITVAAHSAAGNVAVNAGIATISITANDAAVTVRADAQAGVANIVLSALQATVPLQFIGPPDLIILKRDDSVTISKVDNGIECLTQSLSIIVTDHTNALIIKKVDNAVTVNE